MREIPERPANAAFQKSSTPIPMEETMPSPVTTTRVFMETKALWLSEPF
jgi:hypothetical protein